MLGWGVSNRGWGFCLLGNRIWAGEDRILACACAWCCDLEWKVIYCQTLSAMFRFAQRRPFSKGLCFFVQLCYTKLFFIYVFGCRYGHKSYQYGLNIPRLWFRIGICWWGWLWDEYYVVMPEFGVLSRKNLWNRWEKVGMVFWDWEVCWKG